ncbi:division/cell wall cluster transcriptional repressor MraZ [Gammaproteobacteria bacterium]|nr:division/cell wall cluster transcriptional repressor MraZ [SAR86 cluster bacterium]MDB3975849.1 division/cell wall cluster transcriptional repressor MraZ [Gammaproteobacteria bacterium]MDB3994516.1 division/cell wall cluster transcriptional repressor MraZ [Gammaproteobacteria bacterium]MDC0508754.1 division/cell wall cluster transcriptional repressor MraZ [Gammaproteobacteria bacterium]MDC0545519.1 division/cell wall cluster transcriptional repressor MraZ [Gammaproteobacteria bacterium]|tara:strand:+ start:206 stop:685 length:480 start_codon:yes stop_codon:yes gene_type:complete
MSIGIYGSSNLTLDTKGRIVIPARYRELLRASCEGEMIITKDPQYPALIIYPGKLWKEISQKFEALGGLNQKVRSIQWKILGNASVTDFEVGERMTLLIPQILREFADLTLKENVALVGMGSKFELWNLDNWEKKQSGLQIKGEDLIADLPMSLEEIPF